MFPELKPYLTALVMPPASLLILILLGSLFIASRPKLARRIIVLSVCLLWLLSTNVFSVWLHDQVIPEYPTMNATDLKEKNVQAIVVLGGGVVAGLPGGDQQVNKTSLERLRLGALLARQSGLPLVFTGGAGWGAKDAKIAEADVAEKVLLEAFGVNLTFKETQSRDTQENAAYTWALLKKQDIRKVALVTHSTHMPRACAEFKKHGFQVVEASLGQPTANTGSGLGWFPNASNLEVSQSVLRELLAILVQRFQQ